MLRSRKACWMADRSISKRLFYTSAGVAGLSPGREGLASSRLRRHTERRVLREVWGSGFTEGSPHLRLGMKWNDHLKNGAFPCKNHGEPRSILGRGLEKRSATVDFS